MVTPAQDVHLFWVQVLAPVGSGQATQCLVPQYPHQWLGARVGDEPQKGHTAPSNSGLFVVLTRQRCPCSEQGAPAGPCARVTPEAVLTLPQSCVPQVPDG